VRLQVQVTGEWSKNFNEWSHHSPEVFMREKFMQHRLLGSNAVGCSSSTDAVIHYWTLFVAHTERLKICPPRLSAVATLPWEMQKRMFVCTQ